MFEQKPKNDQDEIEYVGAPTEFADAEEVPEWVATIAKVLFFLPAAFITATTIPILLGIMILACCLFFGCLLSAVI